jgi:hypothetical protein
MMGEGKKIGSMYYEISGDDSKLKASLVGSKATVGDLAKGLGGLGITTAAAMAAVGALTDFMKDSVKAAMEAEKADANLNATLKSTQFAAGLTSEEIKRLTANLSNMSGQDDEAIQNAQSMLLTFTKIGKEVFPQASLAVVNLAAKFGSLDAAAIQVGKALQDPINGVTNLRRIGIMLSETQEKQIKDFMDINDIASAQKIILAELETEFGGLAEAMGGTLDGKIKRLNTSWGNLQETVGKTLIPILADLADAFNEVLTRQEKLDTATKDHEAAVRKTGKTWEEYKDDVLAGAKELTGIAVLQIDAEGNLVKMHNQYGASVKEIVIANYAQSKSEYYKGQAAEQASQEMTQALKDTRVAAEQTAAGFDEFRFAVDGALSPESVKEFVAITKSMSDMRKETLSSGAAIYKSMDDWRIKQYELNESVKETETEIAKLEKMRVLNPQELQSLNAYWKALQLAKGSLDDMKNMSSKSMPAALKTLNGAISGIIDGPASFKSAADAVSWLQKKVDGLAAGTYHTPEQQKELESLRESLVKQKDAIEEAKWAQDKATKQMIFNMLLQKAASDGLTTTEFNNLIKVGTAFNIVDQASADMAEGINSMDLSDANFSLSTVYGWLDNIARTPRSMDFTITTTHITKYGSEPGPESPVIIPSEGESEWEIDPVTGKKTKKKKMAGGGSWIIPPGYNENYPVGPHALASSGERVTVTPANQSSSPVTININGWTGDARVLAAEIERRQQLARLQ